MKKKSTKIKDVKVKCVKTFGPFKEGNEYRCDPRRCVNQKDKNDIQIMVIESETDDGLENMYLVPLEKVYEHFAML